MAPSTASSWRAGTMSEKLSGASARGAGTGSNPSDRKTSGVRQAWSIHHNVAEATAKRQSDTTSSVSAMTIGQPPPTGARLGSPAAGPAVTVPPPAEDALDVVVVVVVVVLGGRVLVVVLVLVVELVEVVEAVEAGRVVLVATAGTSAVAAAGRVVAAAPRLATARSAKVAVDAPDAGAPADAVWAADAVAGAPTGASAATGGGCTAVVVGGARLRGGGVRTRGRPRERTRGGRAGDEGHDDGHGDSHTPTFGRVALRRVGFGGAGRWPRTPAAAVPVGPAPCPWVTAPPPATPPPTWRHSRP